MTPTQALVETEKRRFPPLCFMSSSIIMSHALISYVAILLYSTSGFLIALRLFRRDSPRLPGRTLTLMIGFAGLVLHTWLVYDIIFGQPGFDLAFFNALSLTAWTVVTLLLVSSLTKPVENLGILVLPTAALTLFLEARYPAQGVIQEAVAWPIRVHALLSILAYSLLTLASVQAILLAAQDYRLHHRQPAGFLQALPPLQTMESLLFEMIATGFVLLTLALATGFAFLQDMFAQHLVHKTVLSTLGWLVFGALLIGRLRYGWRGRTAIMWTLSGFVILVLAYFGSKAVLELILHR